MNKIKIDICENLANILGGMVATNWVTQISKNNVKTVSVTFHEKAAEVKVSNK